MFVTLVLLYNASLILGDLPQFFLGQTAQRIKNVSKLFRDHLMLHIKEFTVLTSLQTAEKCLRNEVSR